MSYNETEIPRKRNDWVNMLRELRVGDEQVCSIGDRSRIAVSIAKNFPKVQGQPYRFATKKVDGETFKVIRLRDEWL